MKLAPWIIIILLILFFFIEREFKLQHVCPEPTYCTLNHCDSSKADSIPYEVIKYVPRYYYIDTGSIQYIYHKVDTAFILKDYLSKIFFVDTIANDTNLFAVVFDSVTKNRIVYRKKQIVVYPTIITKTKNNYLPKKNSRKLFLGVGVGRSIDQFGISPSLMYISKKDNAYMFSYDIINKDMYFTIFWKLKFKQ